MISVTLVGICECLCNGHKLLRQTLEIDFCLRRDLAQNGKKKEKKKTKTTGMTKTTSTTQREKKDEIK